MHIHLKRPSLNRKLLILSFTHFLNDVHGTFLATFIPVIVSRLGISYAQAGLLKSLSGSYTWSSSPWRAMFPTSFHAHTQLSSAPS